MYLDALRARYAAVDEVWLIGTRANESPAEPGAGWDLLAFGDQSALRAVRAEPEWHRADVNLFLVIDGDRFEKAWGAREHGSLSDLQWRLEEPQRATYVAPERSSDARPERARAIRVR